MHPVRMAICLWLAVATVGFCQEDAKKLTRSEALNAAVSKAEPEYPIIAKQLKIQGDVELQALVSETGTVEKVTILSGNPVLTKPASEALKKWKFAPALADGKPVKALAPILFTFRM